MKLLIFSIHIKLSTKFTLGDWTWGDPPYAQMSGPTMSEGAVPTKGVDFPSGVVVPPKSRQAALTGGMGDGGSTRPLTLTLREDPLSREEHSNIISTQESQGSFSRTRKNEGLMAVD